MLLRNHLSVWHTCLYLPVDQSVDTEPKYVKQLQQVPERKEDVKPLSTRLLEVLVYFR